ncbi:MAG: sugar phosphate isomerase/epimerase family protein [Terrimicrobiaceae bacterium]
MESFPSHRPKRKSSPIKLACADFTFPLAAHNVSLDLISALGFGGVDVGFFEGRSHVQPAAALRKPVESARQLRVACEDRGLAIADLFLIPGVDVRELAPNHPDSVTRKRARSLFERSIAFAQACGAGHFSVLPGVAWTGESRRESFSRCVEEMAWRVESAASAGMPFSIEAHTGSIVEKPPQVLALLKEVPNLRLTLDYGHFANQGFGVEEIEPLLFHANHFHARGGCKGKIQAISAENSIDFPRMVKALQRNGYPGWICLEYVWMAGWDCNRVDNLSETILLRDVLRQAMGVTK